MIACFVEENHENWDRFLHEFAFPRRTSVNETTNKTAAELFLGRKIITPFSKLLNVTEGAEYVGRNIETLFDEARQNMRKHHKNWGKYYNRKRREVNIKVNDLVLVQTHFISAAGKRVVGKFMPKFEGPYRVLEVRNNNLIIWKKGKSVTVNIDQVQVYHPRQKTSSEESNDRKTNKGNAGREHPRLKRKVGSNGSRDRKDLKRSKICRKRSLPGSEHKDQKSPTPEPKQEIKRTIPSSVSSRNYKYRRPNNPSQGSQSIASTSHHREARQGKPPTEGSKNERRGKYDKARETRTTTSGTNRAAERRPVRSNQATATVRVEGVQQSSFAARNGGEGPSWLHLSPQEWPISDVEVDVNEVEVNKERRAIVTSMMNVQTTDIKSDYFSIYSRNNRVVAWMLRFIHNVSNATKLKGSLGYEEFKRAEVLIFKSLQSNAFQDERLLAKMQAFKDEDGLLRIRTKLTDSYEKGDFKFPILLPANDVVVKLIREEHVKAMHAGSSILRARLREKFWIIRAKRLVKQVLSECVICKRYIANHVEVPFAPLPRDRVTQTKIFEVTGVDYAGPLYLKSKAKAWIVLFTCAVYRAVHFELVQSLTTDTCIQALRRFIARRGRISVFYSGNGTNFVGTNNALRTLDWDKIVVYSTAQKITLNLFHPQQHGGLVGGSVL
ncbi:integrase_H2C2 domain-containing protein [Trichonephila clavipes]|nr:integrase_H2C2 domain-containing protein [Trichonephila clavipes]